MKIIRIQLIIVLCLGSLLSGFSQSELPGQLKVGAAKVDITPDPSELAQPTDIIRDHLYVRAIYLTDGTTCAILVSVDAGMVHNIDSALMVSSASTGCPVDNYVVTATHTHSGNTGGLFGGAPTDKTIADAVISSVDMAKSRIAPARVGYGTTEVDLNVNRDNFDENLEWHQTANWDGVSDKTLAVLTFLGEDDVPIAVFMNYGMHPVNFFMSGVISSDFPGDATAYIEDMFDNKTVALFSQGTSGDQNPKMAYTSIFRDGPIKAVLPQRQGPSTGNRPSFTSEAVPEQDIEAHKKTIERKSEYVHMLGTMLGNSAVRVMLYDTDYETDPGIWAGKKDITCPGRIRLDNTGRENYDPGYKDGPDVTIGMGLLQIGDINLVTVSGEVYTDIGLRLKDESPASKTMMVTLTSGPRGPGYIYSDDASYHLTFQVIGSRLQPGCAETGIVNTALDLMKQAKK